MIYPPALLVTNLTSSTRTQPQHPRLPWFAADPPAISHAAAIAICARAETEGVLRLNPTPAPSAGASRADPAPLAFRLLGTYWLPHTYKALDEGPSEFTCIPYENIRTGVACGEVCVWGGDAFV